MNSTLTSCISLKPISLGAGGAFVVFPLLFRACMLGLSFELVPFRGELCTSLVSSSCLGNRPLVSLILLTRCVCALFSLIISCNRADVGFEPLEDSRGESMMEVFSESNSARLRRLSNSG